METVTTARTETCLWRRLSPAGSRRFIALWGNAKTVETGAVAGHPSVGRLLHRRDRRQPVGGRQQRPAGAEIREHPVDGRGAGRSAAIGFNRPGGGVQLDARKRIALFDPRRLVGNDQHPAGPVAPADPARDPRSNSSGAVEQENHRLRHTGILDRPGEAVSGLDYRSREVSPHPNGPVIVVGAGPVGSVTAALLGRRGIPVLLLEKGTFPRDKPCGEGLMPGGVAVLKGLGIDLAAEGFPRLGGIRYRTAEGDAAFGAFRGSSGGPDHGFGVRRIRFDALLAQRAAATPGVRLEVGCTVSGLTIDSTGVSVETNRGRLRGSCLVGADGLRSGVRQILGWDRPASRTERFGLVGHLTVPGHDLADVNVTVLDGVEVYVAPSGPDEVLAAVLGRRGELRVEDLGVADSYRCFVTAAHPAFAGAAMTKVTGAGPFGVSARRVAAGRTFLVGDAAGFVDPITGDAMAAGFRAGSRLATLLEAGPDAAAAAYRRWFAGQWRTRRIVSGLALRLTASPALARRALRGLDRRPGALEGLLAVNSGTSGLSSLSIRDWSALAGV